MARRAGEAIAMVAYTYYPWDPRVRREAETLARRGNRVSVVCARRPGQPVEETVAGVTVRRVPLTITRGGLLRYAYQYVVFLLLASAELRLLRRHPGLSAVHVHSLPDFLVLAGLGARLRGRPLVLDLHEALPEIFAARFPGSSLGLRVAASLEKVSCLLATRVLVVNETIRDLLASRGVPPERVTVLYNSPDIEHAADVPLVELPISTEGRLRIVYAGTVDPERDVGTLVRAAAALRQTAPVALVIYGPGPAAYRRRLEDLVERLGVGDSVRFGGTLPSAQVLSHLSNTDVGVVTYVRNPLTDVALPNKVFEYVLLDKPLVLPNLRAMRRTFAGAALFYEPGNPSDLAAKIRAAAAGDARAMRERAQAVYEGARWEVQATRLMSAYAPSDPRPDDILGEGSCM